MIKKKQLKLHLNVETLRVLTPNDMAGIVGGKPGQCGSVWYTCTEVAGGCSVATCGCPPK